MEGRKKEGTLLLAAVVCDVQALAVVNFFQFSPSFIGLGSCDFDNVFLQLFVLWIRAIVA